MESINQSESCFYGKSSEQHGTHPKSPNTDIRRWCKSFVNILFEVVQCALQLESTTTNVTDVSFCLVCRCVHVLNVILQRVFRLKLLTANLTRILLLHISLVPVGLLMFSQLMCGGKLSGTILASFDNIVVEDSVSLHRWIARNGYVTLVTKFKCCWKPNVFSLLHRSLVVRHMIFVVFLFWC